MADITVPGPISGKEYLIRIAGDEPTADERQQIDAFLRQSEKDFAAKYEEQFGEDLLPGRGVGANVSEFFRGIPRGAGSLLESAALGAATPLEEGYESPAREGIRSLGAGLQERFAAPIGRGDMVAGTLGEGLGSTVPFFALAPFGPPGIAAGAALGAAAGAGEASERARAGEATQEERDLAAAAGAGVGLSEIAVPAALRGLFRSLRRAGVPPTTIAARLSRIGSAASAEGAQEAAAEFLQNSIESGVYNPEKDVADGLLPAGGTGAGVGAIIQGLVELGTRSRGRAVSPPAAPPRDTPERFDDDPGVPEISEGPSGPVPGPTPVSGEERPRQPGEVRVNPVISEAREYFEERAAVIEEGSGVSREQAEQQAAQETLTYIENTGQSDNPVLRPMLRSLRNRAAQNPLEAEGPAVSDVEVDAGPPTPPLEAYADEYAPAPRQEREDLFTARQELEREAPQSAATPEVQDGTGRSSRPFEYDLLGGRIGTPDSVTEPEAELGGTPADTSGIEAPVEGPVGEPVLGAPEPDAGTSGIASALTAPTPPAYRALVDRAPAAEETSAEQAEPTPTPAPPIERTPVQYDPRSGQIPGQETGAPGQNIPPSPQLAEPPARENPEEADAAVREAEAEQRRAPSDPEGMTRLMDEIGVGPKTKLRRDVRSGAVTTPEQFVEGLSKTQLRDPEAKSRRDNWLKSAQEQSIADARQNTDPAVDRVTQQIVEAQERGRAEGAFEDWFDRNASDNLLERAMLAEPGDRERASLPSADTRAVLALLQSPKSQDSAEAAAARKYFSRHPDPGHTLHVIAHDAAHARHAVANPGKRAAASSGRIPRLYTAKMAAGDLSESDRRYNWEVEYLKGLGYEPGAKASQWVIDNLSAETVAETIRLRDSRATKGRTGYALIDYGSRSEGSDSRRADETEAERNERQSADWVKAQKQKEAEEKRVRERLGLGRDSDPFADRDIAEELGFAEDSSGLTDIDFGSFANTYTWPGDAHPRVGALLRAGRFGDAVRALSLTAPNGTMRAMAEKIAARVEDTTSQVVPAETMDRVRRVLSPETPELGVESPAGVYVHPRTPDAISSMRREGHNEAADLIEEFSGQILLNEDTSLAPELVMHEAAHVVADKVLTNRSHPLTRQLDTLRTNLLKSMPATQYGLSNVREFFAEGMTNPVFRRNLSYATTEGKPRSAWQEFKNIVRNWMRGLIGRQPIKGDTALSAVDRALDAVIAMNPNEMQGGSLTGASFSPGGATKAAQDLIGRARMPTKADGDRIRATLQSAYVPASWKAMFLRLGVPMDYMTELAEKYMPSARDVFKLAQQHQADIQKNASTVMQTTEETAKKLGKYRTRPEVVDDFNTVIYEGSRSQVDPRKPKSAYEGYSFQYNLVDASGSVTRRVESKRFPTERERNKALQAYNAALSPDQRANPVARAKVAFSEDPEILQDYASVKARYDRLPDDLKPEVSRMFELQPAVSKELIDAIRARLEALLPQNRAMQDKVFGMIYDKMLSGNMLDPYVALRRTGQYWLSYTAVDPLTVTRDPETGVVDTSNAQITVFKESFETQGQRAKAMQLLQSLPADQQVSGIEPYENPGSENARPTVSLEFVSGVLDAIDSSDTLSRIKDPVTGKAGAVKKQIIDLMFDTLPETSFMNSFKRREGVRGFIGDTTPLTENVVAGDVVKNLRESAMRVSRQAVDLKYGAKFSATRKALTDELTKFQKTNPDNLPVEELAKRRAEALQYYDMVTEYTTTPFRVRSKLSRNLTGGAYMLTLGFNASTALITMSQIPLFVAPFLAGKHGMRNSVAMIREASAIITGSGKERTVDRIGPDGQVEQMRIPVRIWDFSLDNYDFTLPENGYLSRLHDVAKRNGVFNRSLMQDELLGEQPTKAQRFFAATGLLQHHAERYSREVALISAYNLELQNAMGQQDMRASDFVQGLKDGTIEPTQEQQTKAAEDAVNVSEKTNGPIYASAGPLASHGDITAIMYLFKRHPISMLNLMYQTASRSNPWGTSDPEDRKVAQRQLAGMMGMMGVMAGAAGIPMMQQLGWLYDGFFADDDEPDFDTVMRTTLGAAGTHGLVDYLTGMKVSNRIGLGDAIYRPSFASDNLPILHQILEGIGGPVVGLGLKYTDRAPDLLARGEYDRFMETILPSAVANAARAARFSGEGIESMRGDPIIDDVGPFHIAAQALGFMPTEYAQRLAMNSVGTRINNAIQTERTDLLSQRNKALLEGDLETVRDVDQEIEEFNNKHPQYPVLPETKLSSIRAFRQRSARMNQGLAVSPKNQAMIDAILEQYGRSSVWE